MKKVVIVGCSGLTGSKLLHSLSENYDVYGLYNTRHVNNFAQAKIYQQDITIKKQLKQKITEITPDIIVNLAAYNDVDGCEGDREKALSVNYQAVESLTDISNEVNAKFITVSTDNVFDGQQTEGHAEDDIPNPVNFYGYSKYLGEKYVKDRCNDFCIVRTSNLFGYSRIDLQDPSAYRQSSSGKLNFGLKFLIKLSNGETLQAAEDMIITPTLSDTLTTGLAKIIEKDVRGIYHIAGLTCINRYEYTKRMAEYLGYSTSRVIPTTAEKLNLKAIRPKRSCLRCEKFDSLFPGILMPLDKALSIFRYQVSTFTPYLLGEYNKRGN